LGLKQGLEGRTRAQISKELGGRSIFPDPLHSSPERWVSFLAWIPRSISWWSIHRSCSTAAQMHCANCWSPFIFSCCKSFTRRLSSGRHIPGLQFCSSRGKQAALPSSWHLPLATVLHPARSDYYCTQSQTSPGDKRSSRAGSISPTILCYLFFSFFALICRDNLKIIARCLSSREHHHQEILFCSTVCMYGQKLDA
jgi:hypothetical protein